MGSHCNIQLIVDEYSNQVSDFAPVGRMQCGCFHVFQGVHQESGCLYLFMSVDLLVWMVCDDPVS
jgi:hypothetical protein